MTILEASAGTGKTFTIAALVARLVADGVVPLAEESWPSRSPGWPQASCETGSGSGW